MSVLGFFFYLIQILWPRLSVASTVSISNTRNTYNILDFTTKRTYYLCVTENQRLCLNRKRLFSLGTIHKRYLYPPWTIFRVALY
jgi:hypothetical protein